MRLIGQASRRTVARHMRTDTHSEPMTAARLLVVTAPSPAASTVEDRLFGGLAVLRVVVLLNALGLGIYRRSQLDHAVVGAACLGVMVLWTGLATWAYRRPRHRTTVLLVLDLGLALALVLITPWVKGADFRATIPGSWIVAALLAWAIHFRWFGGLAAGALLATADLSSRQVLHQSDYGNAFLLLLAGTIVGYLCGSLQRMATELERAERAAAVAQERARLARAVHDGVLQALALIHRRGRELGGEAARLGELADQQERELRRLIRSQDAPITASGRRDLARELTGLEGIDGVTVSTPGFEVDVSAEIARDLVAAVRACIDNVKVHVGEDAPAWVLLQARPELIEVSVRDAGAGIPPGRLDAAAAAGRLGVVESIRGRIADLGGTAELATGPSGTEWEFSVPRTRP